MLVLVINILYNQYRSIKKNKIYIINVNLKKQSLSFMDYIKLCGAIIVFISIIVIFFCM